MREGNPAPPGDSTLERLMAEADGLYRYALSRVRNHHTAQDLVQETLVTACRKMADFEGRSSLGTWLIGILRHKILDHLRRIERHPEVLGSLPMGEQGEDPGDEWFTRYGAWRLDPNAGLDLLDTDPHQLAERAEIRAAVQECRPRPMRGDRSGRPCRGRAPPFRSRRRRKPAA